MSAVRMDGKALSAKVRGSILAETEALKKQGVTPGLAVIIVGNDPASEIYVRNKERACEQCGFYSGGTARSDCTTEREPGNFGHPVPDAGAEAYFRAGGHRRH